jgi:N-acylneuraminate cytidylyltransferase
LKTVAFVPARCGSKSIHFKNIKDFCGMPLIYWCLKALSDSKEVDEIFVATDCREIEDVVNNLELSKVKVYRRSAKNSADESSTEAVILEFLEVHHTEILKEDLFILSQLTNPFTTSTDYDIAINSLKKSDSDSLLSGALLKRFFWNNTGKPYNYDFMHRPRRQDFEGVILENGAFYVNNVENIKKYGNRLSGNIQIHEMPEYSQTELDEPHDWLIAEALFKHYHQKELIESQNKNIKNIKIVISDVDGVLTDAGMYYSESGEELKKFNTRDGMGFEILRNAGFKTGIITSENTAIVSNRAKKLKVDYLYQGKKEGGKLAAILEICEKENISLNQVAYIGDDINCLNALEAVGLAACPSDAALPIKKLIKAIKLETKGGDGVFREFAELILKECL